MNQFAPFVIDGGDETRDRNCATLFDACARFFVFLPQKTEKAERAKRKNTKNGTRTPALQRTQCGASVNADQFGDETEVTQEKCERLFRR